MSESPIDKNMSGNGEGVGDWERWSKFVLIELGRLNTEIKELNQLITSLNTRIIEETNLKEIINNKLVDISARVDSVVIDFKELQKTVTNLRVTIAEKITYSGIGGAIAVAIIKAMEYIFKH